MKIDSALKLSVAIPTYRRSEAIVNTISQVLTLKHRPEQILVLDQTERHSKEAKSKLTALQERGDIIWQRLNAPSIPRAMNIALVECASDIVLFLDDDIEITSEIVYEHIQAHKQKNALVVIGKIRQPWHKDNFAVTREEAKFVNCAMAGNMSVKRKEAIEVGGFDENFVRVAYRFEDEFAQRIARAGGQIYYHPDASLSHLKINEGGTRAFGNHLTTIKPYHSVGAYYFYLRAPKMKHRVWIVTRRLITTSLTRHHLKKPWWIPITFASELLGMLWAIRLYVKGPRYINK